MSRECLECRASLEGMQKTAKYCSSRCGWIARRKRQQAETTVTERTDSYYAYIANNWDRYFRKILRTKRARCKNIPNLTLDLTPEDLIQKLKGQNYRCALSGVPLSCRLQSGTVYHTNASIDRIIPGGPYTSGNVQLVCSAVNAFRRDFSIEEFVGWCVAVAEFSGSK